MTVRDWFQLSLKEGLTNFRQQGFEEDMTSYATTSLQAWAHLVTTHLGPMCHQPRDLGPRSQQPWAHLLTTRRM